MSVVLTNIGISHLEYFKTKKELAKEKGRLLRSLGVGGLAVLNVDDEECRRIGDSLNTNVITYGFDEESQMRASDFSFNYEQATNHRGEPTKKLSGITFKLSYKGKIIPVRLNYCLGRPQIYAALAAFTVGVYFELNLIEIVDALREFRPAPGRMNLIEGIKNSVIIDDSYNSAPDSAPGCAGDAGKD